MRCKVRILDIEIEGYKSIDDQHLSPSKFTVLIGKNNSGKSNVINALSDYQNSYDVGVSENWHKKRVTEKDPSRPINIHFECQLSKSEYESILSKVDDSIRRKFSDHGWLKKVRIYRNFHPDETHELNFLVWLSGEWQELNKLNKEANWAIGNLIESYREYFETFVESWAFSDPFRKPESHQRPNHTEEMSRDASDLVRRLQSLDRSPQHDIYQDICDSYIDIMEGVTSLSIEHDLDKSQTDKVTLVTEEEGIETRFKADEISSGSKEILALLTQIYAAKQNTGLLAIEEPELHLHPGAEKEIFDIISNVSEEDNLQIIVSTHSEVFVDFTDVGNIVAVRKDPYTQLETTSESEWDRTSILGVNQSDLFQSEAVVFVEGRSDKIILEQFAKCMGSPLKDQGIELVVMKGDQFFSDAKTVLKILKQLQIPFRFVFDSDGEEKDKVRSQISERLGINPNLVHVFERHSIESYLIESPRALGNVFDEETNEIQKDIQDCDPNKEQYSTLNEMSEKYLGTGYNKEITGGTIAKHFRDDEIADEIRSLIQKLSSL